VREQGERARKRENQRLVADGLRVVGQNDHQPDGADRQRERGRERKPERKRDRERLAFVADGLEVVGQDVHQPRHTRRLRQRKRKRKRG
jgi:hypothetical protein